MPIDYFHYLLKYIIVGDTSVGKSCLLMSFTERKFNEEHDTTIGVEYGSQVVKYKDKIIKIQIWDTAGQESFRSVTRSYYKGCIGVILQFDITRRESFYNIVKWYAEIMSCANEHVEIVLVGNKADLQSSRQVSQEEAIEYASLNKFKYFETSAKTCENVEKVFESIAYVVMDKIENNKLDFANDNVGIKLGNFYQRKELDDSYRTQLKDNNKTKNKDNDSCC